MTLAGDLNIIRKIVFTIVIGHFCSLHYLYVAGEHCDHATRIWSEHHFGVPTLDNWWQTETAHAITATCVGLGNKLHPPKDTCGMPVPGFNSTLILVFR